MMGFYDSLLSGRNRLLLEEENNGKDMKRVFFVELGWEGRVHWIACDFACFFIFVTVKFSISVLLLSYIMYSVRPDMHTDTRVKEGIHRGQLIGIWLERRITIEGSTWGEGVFKECVWIAEVSFYFGKSCWELLGEKSQPSRNCWRVIPFIFP